MNCFIEFSCLTKGLFPLLAIAEEEVFPELIQDRFSPYEIEQKLTEWLSNSYKLDEVIEKASLVRKDFSEEQ